MYAAEKRGDVPEGTAERWQKETGEKKLPEKVGDRYRLNKGKKK